MPYLIPNKKYMTRISDTMLIDDRKKHIQNGLIILDNYVVTVYIFRYKSVFKYKNTDRSIHISILIEK
jgi:hypothetical protein